MTNLALILIILLIISLASYKVYQDKKNNVKCSGCPHSKSCETKSNCH